MKLRVPANGLIDAAATLGVLKNHAIPGATRHDDMAGSHTRLLATLKGPVAVTIRIGNDSATVEYDEEVNVSELELIELVRRWLDLDANTEQISEVFASDPIIGPLALVRPGLRIIKCLDEFEASITTVLGQQVSLAAGRTFAGRIVAAYGGQGPNGLRCFPTPARICASAVEEIQSMVGLTKSRARTVWEVANAFASGLTLHDKTFPKARSELLAIHGIGPWSADYLAVRLLGDPDAFAAGDLVLRRALGVQTEREALALAEAWHPWRAYALFHLWTAESYL